MSKKNIIIIAIVLIVIAVFYFVYISDYGDDILPDGQEQSTVLLSDGLENDAVSIGRSHVFYFQSDDVISKIDKIDVRLDCDDTVICKISDTRYVVGSNYKVVVEASISNLDNPNAGWVTIDFEDTELDPDVKYAVIFGTEANIEQIALRKGAGDYCYRIYGW